jgi:hypothetical protein
MELGDASNILFHVLTAAAGGRQGEAADHLQHGGQLYAGPGCQGQGQELQRVSEG